MFPDFQAKFTFWGIVIATALLADLWLMRKMASWSRPKDGQTTGDKTVYVFQKPSFILTDIHTLFQKIKIWGAASTMSKFIKNLSHYFQVIRHFPRHAWLAVSDFFASRAEEPSPVVQVTSAGEIHSHENSLIEKSLFSRLIDLDFTHILPKNIDLVLEIGALVVWALFVGKNYFDFNPAMIVASQDYSLQIYNSAIWSWIGKCGSCILWNGAINGGYPTFADAQGSQFHPLVILTSLIWGVPNGSKIVMLFVLVIVGIGQWWLAKELGLGRLARIWTAAMAVVGPEIGARMESGLMNITLATAMTSLMLPIIVRMFKHGARPKYVVVLGILFASLILSGQGYIQLSFVIGLCPVILYFLIRSFNPLKFIPQAKGFLKAGLLGGLLSGFLIVPYIHLMPFVDKDANSSLNYGLSIIQTMQSLVGKIEKPGTWWLYLGWITILLFFLAVFFARKEDQKIIRSLAFIAAFILFLSTNEFLTLAVNIIPSVDHIRFPNLLSGLSIPFILCTAGFGIETLIQLYKEAREKLSPRWENLFPIAALALVVVCIKGVQNAKETNTQFLNLTPIDNLARYDNLFDFPDTQWVASTLDDRSSIIRMLYAGYHQVDVYEPYFWRNRQLPGPLIRLYNFEPPKEENGILIGENLWMVNYPENTFADVKVGLAQTVCTAENTGGFIDVTCDAPADGVLTVKEFYFSGWKLWIDGRRATLFHNGDFLASLAPAGKHTYQFRYDPWDVKVGAVMTLLGVILAIFWLRSKPASKE